MTLLQTLQLKLKGLQQQLAAALAAEPTTMKIYRAALSNLGRDASPADLADDVVGCAESVTTIIKPILGTPIILGTYTLYEYLSSSPLFQRVDVPQKGTILVSPTGMGNGSISGHTGIIGQNGSIMSNSSFTGQWSSNYTIDTWKARYTDMGGIPMFYFDAK